MAIALEKVKVPIEVREKEVWRRSCRGAQSFAGVLHSRLWKHNKNFIVAFVGEPGVGKSYSAISLAEMIDDRFNADKITWDIEDFLKLLDHCKRGEVVILDEAGVGIPSREWQTIQNKMMSYVMQTFRYQNVGVILTTPSIEYIDRQVRGLIHYVVKVVDRYGNQNMCVVYQKIHDPVRGNLLWDKWLIYLKDEGREQDPNPIFISHPSEYLAEIYEEKSQERKRKLRLDALETYRAFKEGVHSPRHDGRSVRKFMNQSKALANLYRHLRSKYNDTQLAEMMGIDYQVIMRWKKEWISTGK